MRCQWVGAARSRGLTSGVRIFLVAVSALMLSGCARTSAALGDYRPGPGANEITVTYFQRPPDSAGELEILEQDAHRIRVKVVYRAAGGMQDDIAVEREAVAELSEPLGARSVIDENGTVIPVAAHPLLSVTVPFE